MKKLFATCLVVALPSFALSDETLQIVLPSGQIEVMHDPSSFEAVVSFQGETIRLSSGYLPSLQKTWDNAALIFMPTGGSGCPGLFAWLTIKDGDLQATEPFGTCSDLVKFEDQRNSIMTAIPRMDGSGTSGFLYDGKTVREVELGLDSVGIVEPLKAEAWAGKMAGELLSAAEMEPTLLGIMDWETLELARKTIVISSDVMERDGDWYAATGCMPHNCDAMRGGIAVSKKDGSVVVALWSFDTGGKVFGQPSSALPNRIRSVLYGR